MARLYAAIQGAIFVVNMLKELERLKELHGRFLVQANVILGLLEQNDEEAFEDAWYQRQLLFNELDGLNQYLAPALNQWETLKDGLAPVEEERALKVMEQVRDLGHQIGEVDKRVSELLTAQKDEIAQDLGRVKEGQRAKKAYGGGSRRWWGPDRVSRLG
jgi:hypothetical protein